MSAAFEEPTIPALSPRTRRVLVAGWISLGVHAAVIALVQVAPPAAISPGEPVIEARLVSSQAAPAAVVAAPPITPVVETQNAPSPDTPLLKPAESADALPVARPVDAPPVQVAPAAPAIPSQIAPPAEPASTEPLPAPAVAPSPAAIMTSSVDLTYYSAREVDVHPRALREVVPDYPADADRQRVSGKLRLQLKLQADGRVSEVEILSATPPGVFDESALQAFREARFSPARKNGRPVRALVQVEVVYDWAGQDRR
jgi:periplasmic protein TonB